MPAIAIVAMGGGIGAAARFALGEWIKAGEAGRGPWAIFIINITGCLLFGSLQGWCRTDEAKLFFLTGILGGYTTFSTFGFDTLQLMREGKAGWALANGLGSVVAGVLAVWLGMCLARR